MGLTLVIKPYCLWHIFFLFFDRPFHCVTYLNVICREAGIEREAESVLLCVSSSCYVDCGDSMQSVSERVTPDSRILKDPSTYS